MKKAKSETTLVRAALYIRVSGEEQKIKGLSLEAQEERLRDFCKERGWLICGVFIDAAKTARKNIRKRIEFQHMIDGVKQDKYDILVFCRLDRWFRSVADYYKVMDVLNAHNCGWVTSDEDYDTTTANGRLYINVKLSIAQNESDICSERISVVFDSKIQHGTVLSGFSPFWLDVKDKKLVVNEERAAIVRDAIDYFEKDMTQNGTVRYIRNKYGINWDINMLKRVFKNKLLIGVYDSNGRYNDHFCNPIISVDQFNRVQNIFDKRIKIVPTKRVYIFTSILKCPVCGCRLSGQAVGTNTRYYYRCNRHFIRKDCSYGKITNERLIEKWLLENLKSKLSECEVAWSVKKAKKKLEPSAKQKASLKRKLSKLKDLYLNELIDLEDYKRDYIMYSSALSELSTSQKEETPPDFAAVHRILDNDFLSTYNTMDRTEKRTFWQSIIKEMVLDDNGHVTSLSFV